MVVASHTQECLNQPPSEKATTLQLPVIDLSCADRSATSRLIVEACEKYGFFKVVNHGVPFDAITRLEEESLRFFSRTGPEKQRVGAPNPFGYGFKNIGFNGDLGEVEYLMMDGSGGSSSPDDETLECIPPDHRPDNLRSAARAYVEVVRGVACEILDLITLTEELLGAPSLGGMIRAEGNDSVLRINFYPANGGGSADVRPAASRAGGGDDVGLGFGEHTDPQVLTVLTSNDVGGLQVWVRQEAGDGDGDGDGGGSGRGWWTAVPPDPTALWVNVGDLLQAITNGRFESVRHRVVLTTSSKPRMSVAFFGAPPLDTLISSPNQLHHQPVYRPFTWSEYKTATYSRKLGDSRLHLFRRCE
ncbi:hypothetical protein MLD38_035998 [Melastoma candidum]|uniref:Uncharacterized protein n=1 Tax=Melastoma candidum TaxID=119954 RepID=A0ACB9LIQ8_9MYRT|nr:hypothetical protein MLD38_035998 [Melastoma candidum]